MRRSGFTLIELIFVIVILGILAGVALPRFANVSDDAKASTESSNAADIRTAIQNIRASFLLNGETVAGPAYWVAVDDVNISTTAKGYPRDLDDTLGAGATATQDANMSTLMAEPMSGWKITTVHNSGTGKTVYTGPASGIFEYDNTTGRFTKTN